MRIALAALLLRALVPAGLMAAPVAEGWLFQICPSGMAMPSYMALLGQSHHADHSGHAQHEAADSDLVCALGAGFVALNEEPESQLGPARGFRLALSAQPTRRLARAPPSSNRSRAPPSYF